MPSTLLKYDIKIIKMDSSQSDKARKKYAVIPPSVRMAFIKKVLSKQATIK